MRVPSLLSFAVASIWATFPPMAEAQSLVNLYESARAFDANYLSARLQYDANLARADQFCQRLVCQLAQHGQTSKPP